MKSWYSNKGLNASPEVLPLPMLRNHFSAADLYGSEVRKSRKGEGMKYLFAWLLGVPGFIIVIWFIVAHMH